MIRKTRLTTRRVLNAARRLDGVGLSVHMESLKKIMKSFTSVTAQYVYGSLTIVSGLLLTMIMSMGGSEESFVSIAIGPVLVGLGTLIWYNASRIT